MNHARLSARPAPMMIAFGVAICAATFAAPSRAGEFYVSVNGNDSNPGTISSPWRTIQKAADTLAAGDTVYIRAGTYRTRVLPRNSGNGASSLITYAAYPGEAPLLDGRGIHVPEDEGLFYVLGKRYIVASGLKIANAGYAGFYVQDSSYITLSQNRTLKTVSSGIGVWSCSDIDVDGNDVSKACSGGMQESISIVGTTRFQVRNNHVHHVPRSVEKEGICVKDGSSYGKVYGNDVHHTTAVGIYVDAWENRTHHIEIYGNRVHDVIKDSGITVASEMGGVNEDVRIYNNIVYRNGYCGIELSDYGAGPSRPVRRIEIINNTTWGNGIPWGGGITCPNPDLKAIVVRNNICSKNSAFQIAVSAPQSQVTVDHNLIDRYTGEETEVRGTDYVEADPQFVNPARRDFHLKAASRARDSGSPSRAPSFDFEGSPRPQDGDGDGVAVHDMGAYEPSASER
ncbi:MAG: right-handed parallel beta-helix repeat-containing protein [Acidobacteriota bacterium]